jgi:hypothetical protein
MHPPQNDDFRNTSHIQRKRSSLERLACLPAARNVIYQSLAQHAAQSEGQHEKQNAKEDRVSPDQPHQTERSGSRKNDQNETGEGKI